MIESHNFQAIQDQRRTLAIQHAHTPEFQRKHAAALTTIRQALKRSKRPYIAFSGGKDSMAVLGLVHSVDPNVTVHWSDDELEYPENVELMAAIQRMAGPQMVISQGFAEHAGWFSPWRDRPYWREPLPGTLYAGIDSDPWMAQRGHDCTFLGTRSAESSRRADWLTSAGPLYRVKSGTGLRCCPIADWSVDDVWALVALMGLPVNGVYDVLESIGVDRSAQRVGPLPLTPGLILGEGWPEMFDRLIHRYGKQGRWN